MMRRLNYKALIVALVIAALSGVVWIKYLNYHTNEARLKQDVKSKQEQLTSKTEMLKKMTGQSVELQQQAEQLKKEKADLESQLQAKRAEQERVASAKVQVTQTAVASRLPVAVTGTCSQWIAAAGITDVGNAAELIRRESGCNPNAVNRSSGACCVAQELPCGKSGCALEDGACQVRWMDGYVKNRYGSWAGAVAFHNSHNWY